MDGQLIRAAIYARVSSEQQAQQNTIGSQIEAMEQRVREDGFVLEQELRFIDDGFSGSTLVRPALERLRDVVYAGGIDRVYVHSPDRLARKYAYQVLLVDEMKHHGVELVFLNHALGRSPEEDLLLQVQGMISEYERAKIMERSRRGKRHAARRGSVNVLTSAPYGYRYVSKHEGSGEAHFRIIFEEARVVREIFEWVALERLSIGAVCRRLKQQGIRTPTGHEDWHRSTISGLLRNPAYKGTAAFGKTRRGPRLPALRPHRRGAESRRDFSIYTTPDNEQELIAVPAIISADLFDAVRKQVEENKKRARTQQHGARHLLQGLLQCQCCGYAYYGKSISRAATKGRQRPYAYYRCNGSDAHRFAGKRVCPNKPVRTDLLEAAIWDDLCNLLNNPQRIRDEYERRLRGRSTDQPPETAQLDAMIRKLKRTIARLIDAYEDGLLEKDEFEPRLRQARQRLDNLQADARSAADRETEAHELRLVIGQFVDFAQRVRDGLQQPDWEMQREIIRALVKRIEINQDHVRVIYKVSPSPFVQRPAERGAFRQHCPRRAFATLGRFLVGGSSVQAASSPPNGANVGVHGSSGARYQTGLLRFRNGCGRR